MKRPFATVLVLLALGVAALVVWRRVFSREATIDYHTRGWHEAMGCISSNLPKPFISLVFGAGNGSSSGYYDQVVERHEQRLIELGYLTNHILKLTNQMVTREFSSNFFWQIRHQLGTNTEQVWRCPTLPNRDGFNPTMPAKDAAEWERIFRECASRYASNVPSPVVTNSERP